MTNIFNKANIALFVIMVLLSSLIKGVWVYANYGIATDIAVQMNIAESISNGHGIQVKVVENDSIYYVPELTYAPATSVVLAGLNEITNNIIVSDLILRLQLALWESVLIVLIVFKYFKLKHVRLLMTVLFSLYIGHLDRGFTGDYLSFLIVLSLIFLLVAKIELCKTSWPISILISLLIILIPVVKYSSLPVVALPLFCFVVSSFLYKNRKRLFSPFEFILVSTTTVLSFVFFLKLSSGNEPNDLDWSRITYLTRIDYFWMHFGHIGDRIWKHLSWNTSQHIGLDIPYYHLAQIGTVFMSLFMLFVLRKRITFHSPAFLPIILLAILQVGFLGLLTLLYEPQSGNYGIDKKLWVFIEEARYYNYLSFLIMTAWLILTFKFFKPGFIALSILIVLSSFPRLNFSNSRFPIIYCKYTLMNSETSNQICFDDNFKETTIIKRKIFGFK
jgi:hypothetical protein